MRGGDANPREGDEVTPAAGDGVVHGGRVSAFDQFVQGSIRFHRAECAALRGDAHGVSGTHHVNADDGAGQAVFFHIVGELPGAVQTGFFRAAKQETGHQFFRRVFCQLQRGSSQQGCAGAVVIGAGGIPADRRHGFPDILEQQDDRHTPGDPPADIQEDAGDVHSHKLQNAGDDQNIGHTHHDVE